MRKQLIAQNTQNTAFISHSINWILHTSHKVAKVRDTVKVNIVAKSLQYFYFFQDK